MRATSGRTPIAPMVAAALRIAAKQVRDSVDRDELMKTADRVENQLRDEECPLCRKKVCDYMCPITQARNEARSQCEN